MAVRLDEVRSVLARARRAVAEGNADEVASDLDEALAMLDADPLLTAAEAAAALGIESELVVTIWCRQGKLRCETGDGRVMVPRPETERFRDSPEAVRMRWSDAAHAASAEFGLDRDMTDEEMAELGESRPGRLPWQKPATGDPHDRAGE